LNATIAGVSTAEVGGSNQMAEEAPGLIERG
jgi:hypothetical protein